MCRALIITSIILAFFGSILVLVGMKCTKIGGSELANARVTFAGGMNYLISGKEYFKCIKMCFSYVLTDRVTVLGLCSLVAFSFYGNKIRSEFQDPTYKAQRYEHL